MIPLLKTRKGVAPFVHAECSSQLPAHLWAAWRAQAWWPPASSSPAGVRCRNLVKAGPWNAAPGTAMTAAVTAQLYSDMHGWGVGSDVFTSSSLFSSSFFSFCALFSCSLSSKENGQTSTWRCSGNWGWNGRPKWGTGGALICGGGLTLGEMYRFRPNEGERGRNINAITHLYFFNSWFPVNPLLQCKSWRFWNSWKQHLLLRQSLGTTG